jgi:hypothetical protein
MSKGSRDEVNTRTTRIANALQPLAYTQLASVTSSCTSRRVASLFPTTTDPTLGGTTTWLNTGGVAEEKRTYALPARGFVLSSGRGLRGGKRSSCRSASRSGNRRRRSHRRACQSGSSRTLRRTRRRARQRFSNTFGDIDIGPGRRGRGEPGIRGRRARTRDAHWRRSRRRKRRRRRSNHQGRRRREQRRARLA